MIIKQLLSFLLTTLYSVMAASMEIAITVDDLPANGNLPSHVTRVDVSKKMLDVFKKHHISGVYGFINGETINKEPDGEQILENWIDNKHFLGNHTYDHLDFAKTELAPFIENIKQNELILQYLMREEDHRYFRYPYLSEGNTLENRNGVRQFLFENQYKIAQVTVDFFEYEWNDPYVRCLTKNDKASADWIKHAYIEQALNALTISHALSMMLFNRDIKHVMLIHINFMTANMLDELLTAYEKRGVKFISLQKALNDEAYNINPNVVRDRAYTFLNQVRLSRELENPDIVTKLYESLPEDQLDKICR